ncbi:MAG: hypothetical protein LBP63_06805 [Prevotellaceae bacterium]|jgi:hypothetical protein|nr:hypothetical protein [Prevotellaceae bacterium]
MNTEFNWSDVSTPERKEYGDDLTSCIELAKLYLNDDYNKYEDKEFMNIQLKMCLVGDYNDYMNIIPDTYYNIINYNIINNKNYNSEKGMMWHSAEYDTERNG